MQAVLHRRARLDKPKLSGKPPGESSSTVLSALRLVRIEATGSRSATAQLRNLTQRSPLSEVAPFCDRPAFVGRRFFRRRGSCRLYPAPGRAQTCRTRLFASWAVYRRVFPTPYYSPADGNDAKDCASTCRAKTTTDPLFPQARGAFDYACKPGRKPLEGIRFPIALFP